LRGRAPRLAARLVRLFLPCAHLGLVGGQLRCVAFLGARLQHLLGPLQVPQALLAQRDLHGEVHFRRQRTLICLLSPLQQLGHFCAQHLFQFQQPSVAHRMALRGIRVHLAPVHADLAQRQRAQRVRQQQHLREYLRDLAEKGAPEVRQCYEPRQMIRRQHLTNRDGLVQGRFIVNAFVLSHGSLRSLFPFSRHMFAPITTQPIIIPACTLEPALRQAARVLSRISTGVPCPRGRQGLL